MLRLSNNAFLHPSFLFCLASLYLFCTGLDYSTVLGYGTVVGSGTVVDYGTVLDYGSERDYGTVKGSCNVEDPVR